MFNVCYDLWQPMQPCHAHLIGCDFLWVLRDARIIQQRLQVEHWKCLFPRDTLKWSAEGSPLLATQIPGAQEKENLGFPRSQSSSLPCENHLVSSDLRHFLQLPFQLTSVSAAHNRTNVGALGLWCAQTF